MRLSIIIAALNEAATIVATLKPLQAMRSRGVEVILVDGGSSDNTTELARVFCDQVIASSKGRALQMNAGAAAATLSDAYLFLHADSVLPPDSDINIVDALQSHQWGRFDVTIQGAHMLLPMVAWFMNLRSRLTSIATGDQGIFMLREVFEATGGFANQRLMEDVEMCKRLKKIGVPANLKQKIITSGRRWDTHGLWRTIWLMWRLRWQYFFGADADTLHLQYYGR
jgi:rSAM/selenodomain-associated transferase 2